MSVERTPAVIPFDDFDRVPLIRGLHIPRKFHTIGEGDDAVVLQNQRPLGSVFTVSRYEHPITDHEKRVARLLRACRASDGHGGWIEGLHTFADQDTREAEIQRQLSERNQDVQLEPEFRAAFEHPENPDHNRLTMALGRVVGFWADRTLPHPEFGLVVIGNSGIVPAETGHPDGWPLPAQRVFPYLPKE